MSRGAISTLPLFIEGGDVCEFADDPEARQLPWELVFAERRLDDPDDPNRRLIPAALQARFARHIGFELPRQPRRGLRPEPVTTS